MELTHASFFSGVGGLDLGLERAGWRTVSFSEIDPYASTVLAERWPGVPNLGDITSLRAEPAGRTANDGRDVATDGGRREAGRGLPSGSANATLWSGGFPCQDLSVAGKRAGFAGERSSLAFAFLDLVERHRPPAILFENVPGLLSSHKGRDFGALLDRLGQLGYWWAYRILDAQFFGVSQRRRRVFICALHAGAGFGADSAAAVLSVGSRCDGHSAAGHATGEGVAERPGYGIAHALSASHTRSGRYDPNGETYAISPSTDPGGVREADGLAGRMDDLAPTLRVGPARPQDGGPGDTVPIIVNALDQRRGADDNEAQAGQLIRGAATHGSNGTTEAAARPDDPLLPLGLDSHRYRCCGNGVVSNVSEWIGLRLRGAVEVEAAA